MVGSVEISNFLLWSMIDRKEIMLIQKIWYAALSMGVFKDSDVSSIRVTIYVPYLADICTIVE